jgi:ubiquinone biosynthesis protein COQ4
MSVNGFLGSERPPVRFVDDEEKAYVMTRYREIHDFYHVLADLPPTILGEVIVKWVEFFQTGLPMNILGGIFGPLQLPSSDRKILRNAMPWVRNTARNSQDIMCIYFEKHLDQDLEEFRQQIKFQKCPIE